MVKSYHINHHFQIPILTASYGYGSTVESQQRSWLSIITAQHPRGIPALNVDGWDFLG